MTAPAPAPSPLADLSFSLVGPGRVGSSVAIWLATAGARLARVGARRPSVAQELASRLGGEAVDLAECTTGDCDLLLVTVSDDALDEVAARLAGRPQAATALHTCGSRGATALTPLHALGSSPGAWHPLLPFPAIRPVPPAPGWVCAVDGEARALALARRLSAACGARAVEVPEPARSAYHLGATLAAGGVLTLLGCAAELAAAARSNPEIAAGYLRLATEAIGAAAETLNPAAAVTGPWIRGDRATVARHLAALDALAPERRRLVIELASAALAQRQRRSPLGAAESELLATLRDELS